MKKILTVGAITLALITSTSAAIVDKSSVDFSIGTFAFDNANTGASVGMDVKGEKNIFIDGLFLGVGINAEIFDPKDVRNKNDDLGLVADVYPTLSYEITNNLSVNTLYGYTIGQVGSDTFDGTSYGVGVDYKLSDKFMMGLNYKSSDLEFTSSKVSVDADRYNLSFSFKF
jgi:opacity protein-like surface antigen